MIVFPKYFGNKLFLFFKISHMVPLGFKIYPNFMKFEIGLLVKCILVSSAFYMTWNIYSFSDSLF